VPSIISALPETTQLIAMGYAQLVIGPAGSGKVISFI